MRMQTDNIYTIRYGGPFGVHVEVSQYAMGLNYRGHSLRNQ